MNKIYIFICILLFASCGQSGKPKETSSSVSSEGSETLHSNVTTDNLKEIKLDPYDKGHMYDDLIDSVSFIKLQTTADNLMVNVDNIFFLDDKIIIVDCTKLKTILVYDYSGHFLYKISRRGLGPDEYATLSYTTLSLDKSQIIVVDLGSKKLKYFSIDENAAKISGSFLVKSENLPYDFSDVEFLTEDIVAGYDAVGNAVPNTSDLYRFILSDLNGKIYYSGYKSYYSKHFNYSTSCPLHKYGSDVFFNPSYNDTVFVVRKDGLEARYVINIKGHKELVMKDNITNDEFSGILESTNYFQGKFVELKDVAVFNYMSHVDRSTWGLYIKSENKTYNCNGNLTNPIMAFCNGLSFYYKDNTLAKLVGAGFFLQNKDYILKTWKSPNAKALFENLTEEDNPVLLFYHMKTKMK